LEQNEPSSPLKTLVCRKCSFERLIQFSLGNYVLDAATSNIDGFLWCDKCASLSQLSGLFGTKRAYVHSEKPKLQDVFLTKTKAVLTGNNVQGAPDSNTDGFLLRDSCVS
jgi:hypothetical protein